jgi:hypothetical protein
MMEGDWPDMQSGWPDLAATGRLAKYRRFR